MAGMVQVTGVNKVLVKMATFSLLAEKKMEQGLKRGGLFIQRESQKIVPIDTGDLKGTAKTDNIGGTGKLTDIVVHYGAGANYAVIVHEDMEARHKKGKTAKYLERVFREKRGQIFSVIAGIR